MRKARYILSLCLVLVLAMSAVSASQVIVSPRVGKSQYEYNAVPSDVHQQIGAVGPDLTDPKLKAETDLKIASIEPEYLVTPGDMIRVTYLEKTGQRPVTAVITVPLSGEVRLSTIASIDTLGKTYQAVKTEIETALTNYSRYSEPMVDLVGLGVFTVGVKGETEKATNVRVNGLVKLSDLMYLAGENASTRCVKVADRNGNTSSYDIYKALREGEDGQNPSLRPGDTVEFTKMDRTVVISGAVSRPGTYQLLEGENLPALMTVYADGLSSAAAGTVTIERASAKGFVEKYEVTPGENIILYDGDVIYAEPAIVNNSSVSIEGAIGARPSAGTKISGGSAEKFFYRYAEGETVYDLVIAMSELFSSDSDIENAYLIRNGEKIAIDFAEVLYGGAEKGQMKLEAADRFFVPFRQMQVTVLGGVKNPGIYGYVPGRGYDYYIKMAGGYSNFSKEESGMTIRDRNGNELSTDDEILPETVIEVEEADMRNNTANTVAIVGAVAGVLGIISTIIMITANIMDMAK